jgi:hypothetical protein
MSDLQLINFDSPPGSPTLTQKSNSDCISVDSFSSDSNYSSPHNGSMSQAESGFEDDFGQSVAINKDPWDLFSASKTITTGKTNVGGSSFYGSTATIRAPPSIATPTEFLDPLCNGKTAVPKLQTKVMPTIIKPAVPVKSTTEKPRPLEAYRLSIVQPTLSSSSFDEVEDYDLPSLPMPSCPPPPPPTVEFVDDMDQEMESYGIALFDFNGEHDTDLSFRVSIATCFVVIS